MLLVSLTLEGAPTKLLFERFKLNLIFDYQLNLADKVPANELEQTAIAFALDDVFIILLIECLLLTYYYFNSKIDRRFHMFHRSSIEYGLDAPHISDRFGIAGLESEMNAAECKDIWEDAEVKMNQEQRAFYEFFPLFSPFFFPVLFQFTIIFYILI